MSDKCKMCKVRYPAGHHEEDGFACVRNQNARLRRMNGRLRLDGAADKRQLAQRDEQLAEKETEIAALGQELADLKETEKELWDQCITDQICFYRNLAIRYGAKPEDMDNEWDAKLADGERAKDEEIAGLKAIVELVQKCRALALSRSLHPEQATIAVNVHPGFQAAFSKLCAAVEAALCAAAEAAQEAACPDGAEKGEDDSASP